jgi:hypothetical protein
VTQQVVEEVQRNKLEAAKFLVRQFGQFKLQTFAVPDHLFGADAGQSKIIKAQMAEILQRIE